jgi:hypothetical protein
VILVFNSSPRDNFFVDLDTDKDNIGNLKDDDDDNDGFSDKEDAEPLVFNKRPEPEKKPPGPKPILDTPKKSVSETPLPEEKKIISIPGPVKEVYEIVKNAAVETVVKINEFADAQRTVIEIKKEELKEELGLVKVIVAGGGGEGSGGGGGGPAGVGLTGFFEKLFGGFRSKADANNDGRVDLFDFNILMVNWEMTNENNAADFNSDRRVDILDFNLLMVNWN